jgi:hypothetical protein
MNNIRNSITSLLALISRFRGGFWGIFLTAVTAAVMLLIFRADSVITRTVGWEKGYQVAGGPAGAANFRLAFRGNYSIAVSEIKKGGLITINAAVSFDRGSSFLENIKIAEIESSVEAKPCVSVGPGGAVAAAWQQFDESEATTLIYYSLSSDSGATWAPPVKMSSEKNSGALLQMMPEIHYDDRGVLHLFFHAVMKDSINLFHGVKKDESAFTDIEPVLKLEKNMVGAFFPSIHIRGSRFILVWQGKSKKSDGASVDNLYMISSSNYGRGWSSIQRITSGDSGDASPDILLHNGTLYVVYQNNKDKNWALYLLKGANSGSSWKEPPVKITETGFDCYKPRLSIFKDDIVITWYDYREKDPHIFVRKYSIAENTLSETMKLSGIRPSVDPIPAAFADRMMVFWTETGRLMARQSDIYSPPPVVFSETHPAERWSREPVAVLRWRQPDDESGISGYAAVYNAIPDFNPTIEVLKGEVNRFVVPDVKDGVSYFHIRSIDKAGNYSRTIHHRIQACVSPPPMPVVVSMTHPQGEPTDSNEPLFRWAVEGTDRIKGFSYSLSKDRALAPARFTTDFELKFDSLEPGGYFLTVDSIDMTNQKSRVAVYNFIVGAGGGVDKDYIRKIASQDFGKKGYPTGIDRPAVYVKPGTKLTLSGSRESIVAGSQFKAVISPVNIRAADILGHAIVFSREKLPVPGRINFKSEIITFDRLKSGTYHLGVKTRYKKPGGGSENEVWTDPVYLTVKVNPRPIESDLVNTRELITQRMLKKGWAVFSAVFLLSAIALFSGAGTRINFHRKNFTYRFRRFMNSFRKD